MAIDPLQEVKDAVSELGAAVSTEIQQVADALANNNPVDPAAVAALAQSIREQTQRIANMIPDSPTEPPPAP